MCELRLSASAHQAALPGVLPCRFCIITDTSRMVKMAIVDRWETLQRPCLLDRSAAGSMRAFLRTQHGMVKMAIENLTSQQVAADM